VLSSGAASFEVFFPERDDVGNIITNTLRATRCASLKKR
jgi:DNA-directed RNA polymerase subunit beta